MRTIYPLLIVTNGVVKCLAFRASTVYCCGDEALLGIVAYKAGKDRMPMVDSTVAICEADAVNPSILERSEYFFHSEVEDICENSSSCGLVGDIFKLACWKITKQDLRSA